MVKMVQMTIEHDLGRYDRIVPVSRAAIRRAMAKCSIRPVDSMSLKYVEMRIEQVDALHRRMYTRSRCETLDKPDAELHHAARELHYTMGLALEYQCGMSIPLD